jgi:tetratricopeptide (TPR) repeat protein
VVHLAESVQKEGRESVARAVAMAFWAYLGGDDETFPHQQWEWYVREHPNRNVKELATDFVFSHLPSLKAFEQTKHRLDQDVQFREEVIQIYYKAVNDFYEKPESILIDILRKLLRSRMPVERLSDREIAGVVIYALGKKLINSGIVGSVEQAIKSCLIVDSVAEQLGDRLRVHWALLTEPGSVDYWVDKAWGCQSRGLLQNALWCVNKALEIDSRSPSALYCKGAVLIEIGRPTQDFSKVREAKKLFELVLQIDPNHKEAKIALEMCRTSLGER